MLSLSKYDSLQSRKKKNNKYLFCLMQLCLVVSLRMKRSEMKQTVCYLGRLLRYRSQRREMKQTVIHEIASLSLAKT